MAGGVPDAVQLEVEQLAEPDVGAAQPSQPGAGEWSASSLMAAASPLGDALNAVAHAAITGYGVGPAELWPLLGRFGLARHLTPARAG